MVAPKQIDHRTELAHKPVVSVHAVKLFVGFLLGVLVLTRLELLTVTNSPVAAFRPVNALLLAVLVRWPNLCRLPSWLGAAMGYFLAEYWTGFDLFQVLNLASANVASALIGVTLFRLLARGDQLIQRPASMLFLLVIAMVCSSSQALIANAVNQMEIMTLTTDTDAEFEIDLPVVNGNELEDTILNGDDKGDVSAKGSASEIKGLAKEQTVVGFGYWTISEFVNYLLVLPLVLTTPTKSEFWVAFDNVWTKTKTNPFFHAPLVALLGAAYLTVTIGGPGAIVFVVPPLLWCSLTYPRFTTSMLSMLTLAWLMSTVSVDVGRSADPATDIHDTMSLRLGVSLIAVVPMMVSCVEQARSQLIAKLSHAVQFDYLTGVYARKFYLEKASAHLNHERDNQRNPFVTCMMLDIDHFKSINDNFGHAAGDEVLRAFAAVISKLLRKDDLFGRMGGEEFTLFMLDATPDVASAVAERIRDRIESTPIELHDGQIVHITVSIGVISCPVAKVGNIESLLQIADQSLYIAKASGRNRVHMAPAFIGQTHGHIAEVK